MQRTIHVLLTLIIVWQTLGAVSPSSVAMQSAEIEHFSLHAHADSHHHHDDRSLHLDYSDQTDDAPQHLHADSGLQPSGLVPRVNAAYAIYRPVMPTNGDDRPVPAPHLKGLLRPPQLPA